MNLFDALAQKLFGKAYIFEQYVIYHIPEPRPVELLEIYFTRAGQGYASSGGGMSHTGTSCSRSLQLEEFHLLS